MCTAPPADQIHAALLLLRRRRSQVLPGKQNAHQGVHRLELSLLPQGAHSKRAHILVRPNCQCKPRALIASWLQILLENCLKNIYYMHDH